MLVACGDSEPDGGRPDSTSPPPTILERSPTELELPIRLGVTLPLFEDFARAAGGENVEVVSLIPLTAEPHEFDGAGELSRDISGIDFFFVNGLGLDDRLASAIEAGRDEQAFVVPFAANIQSPRGSELGNVDLTAEAARDNPHLWLDPNLAYVYVEIIADEFVIYDGVRKAFYDDNFARFRDGLVALRDELSAEIDKIPQARRKLITYHNSFEHFARRFEMEVAGFAIDSPGAQPDAAAINGLVAKVQAEGIPAVFAEHGHERGAIDEIASRAGVPVCTLYSDVLPDGVDAYDEMMRANVAEMVRCLGGE
jgi:zinc/manganese transport system substrate-binding protein/zinc transport system substrate-binding protein